MSKFFVVKTDMVRTPTGLIVPGRSGEALVVIGTLATQHLDPALTASGVELAPHQAAVVVDIGLFLEAAKDLAQERQARLGIQNDMT